MTRTPDELPTEIEERLFAIHFDADAVDRAGLIDELCAREVAHGRLIRKRAEQLRSSERALGRLHAGLSSPLPEVGPFAIERVLGEGGFGTVYLAEQHDPVRRQVALKVMRPGRLDERSRQRFADEQQLLARLRHACIAQVYDAGETDAGQRYFAMELVDGLPITRWCELRKADLETRLRLFVRVCAAIHHAHQRGVVHRDIKPSNVLVTDEDGRPLPKVIDFGIGKLLEPDAGPAAPATRRDGQTGTPGYMSPEQSAGQRVDTRTDVYSLGVLLCELLTGNLPFDRDRLATSSFAEVTRILTEEAPRRPSQLVDDAALRRRLATDLDWVVLVAVAADPEARYSSVAALADDVERHLRCEPVAVRRTVTSYVVGRFVRRHRVAVASTLLLVAATAAILIALVWGLGQLHDARTVAERQRDAAEANQHAASMVVAQLAMEGGDIHTARHHLGTIPRPRRGWEWRHLAAHLDHSVTCREIGGEQQDVVWLDADRLLTMPLDGAITVRDPSGAPIRAFEGWHGTFRRFALDRDRGRIVLAADEGVTIWDLGSCRATAFRHDVPEEPFGLALSPDGDRIAVSGRGGWLHVVATSPASEQPPLALQTDGDATALHFVSANELLVGLASGTIQRVALPGNEVLAELRGHTDHVEDLLVLPDRDLLFSASIDTTVRAWRLSTGAPLAELASLVRMRRLVSSSDGARLYACGGWSEGQVAAWETTTFTSLGRYHGHAAGVRSLSLRPDDDRLASVSRDRTLRLWPSLPPQRATRLECGVDARTLVVDRDGELFATAAIDGTVRVWNAATLEPVLDQVVDMPCTTCALGERVVYVSGREIRAIDVDRGIVTATGPNGGRRMENMMVDPSGRWLVAGFLDDLVVWQLPEITLRHELRLPVGTCRLAWDHVDATVMIACGDGKVRWLQPATGAIVRERQVLPPGRQVGGIARHRDLTVLGAWGDLRFLRPGEPTRHETASCLCAAVAPGGHCVATGGGDHKVRLWDPQTGSQLLVLGGLQYAIPHVRWVDGGARILALAHRWTAPSYVYAWHAPPAVELPR